MLQTKATVNVKDSSNKVIASRDYQKLNFHGNALDGDKIVATGDGGTPEALLGAAIEHFQKENPKGNGVIDLLEHVTYSYDLGQRAKIRQALVNVATPEKAFEKQVQLFMAQRAALGKPVTREKAEEKVKILMADEDEAAA